jgi:hypothetical protein
MANNFTPDSINDEVRGWLERVQQSTKGTREHKEARERLEECLKRHGFETFRGRHESMPIGKVGDSAIVEVTSRRGQLAKYHGKTLRLAVAGRGKGSNGRIFAAKEL